MSKYQNGNNRMPTHKLNKVINMTDLWLEGLAPLPGEDRPVPVRGPPDI